MILSFDRTSSVTESKQIYHQLRQRIETGELAPGATLPSVSFLARQMQLPKSTVARAYELLVTANMIIGHSDEYVVKVSDNQKTHSFDTSAEAPIEVGDIAGLIEWCAILPEKVSHLHVDRGERSEWAQISLFSVDGEEEAGIDQIGMVKRWTEEQQHQAMEPAHLLTELNAWLVKMAGIERPKVDAISFRIDFEKNIITFSTAGTLLFCSEQAAAEVKNPRLSFPGLGSLPDTRYPEYKTARADLHCAVSRQIVENPCGSGQAIGYPQFEAELDSLTRLPLNDGLTKLESRFKDICETPLRQLGHPMLLLKVKQKQINQKA